MLLASKQLIIAIFVIFLSNTLAQAGPHILVDIKTGKVLAADRATDLWYPASITKLMTLYVAAEAIRDGKLSLSSTLEISKRANRTPPSKMGFKTGTKVTLQNAFPMLIVKSANDIAVAIAERVSGSHDAFIAEMNRTAKRIGMRDSRFTNPHGLPSKGQYVTARDMAVLGVAIHREFPELLPLFDIPAIRFGKRVLRSHNLLLEHYRGASGMKTGFICAAGLNMVATAKRGKKNYLTVILGERSSIDRNEKAALLLESAFSGQYKSAKGSLASYHPRATRSTPANLRPLICGGHRKIRQFQLVIPQPRPKRGLFTRKRYASPQRKDFGPNLGDRSHPQGTLVFAPRGRKYRSHILQPRRAGEILRVYAQSTQFDPNAKYAIKTDRRARKRFAALSGTQSQSETLGAATSIAGIPLPRQRPLAIVKRDQLPTTASAFTNASSGAGASSDKANASSLFERSLAKGKKEPKNAAEKAIGGPLIIRPTLLLNTTASVPFPPRNPVR